jgi:hypothetical protein
MLQVKTTFERWLTQSSKNLAGSIFSTRVTKAVFDFLLSRKLVTKSFVGIDFGSSASNSFISGEIKKLHKILLVNMRKKLPMLKMGDVIYEAPYLQFYNRANCTYMVIPDNTHNRLLIPRYFRYIKFQSFLAEQHIPLTLESSYDTVMINGLRMPTITIKFHTSSRLPTLSFRYFPLVFILPQAIRVLTTLHRKAYFKNDDLNSAAARTPTGVDDDPGLDAERVHRESGVRDDF